MICFCGNVRQKVIAQLSFAALIFSKSASQNCQEEPLALHRSVSCFCITEHVLLFQDCLCDICCTTLLQYWRIFLIRIPLGACYYINDLFGKGMISFSAVCSDSRQHNVPLRKTLFECEVYLYIRYIPY